MLTKVFDIALIVKITGINRKIIEKHSYFF
jgi:hypothetical protein